MSQVKRNYGQAGKARTEYASGGRNRNAYIYDNTARKLDVVREIEDPSYEQESEHRRRHQKIRTMSVGYIMFLVFALCMSAIVLMNYVKVKSELTNATRSVARKEIQLDELKVDNDEKYNRISNSVDLEEIKRIAIEELGMVYAQEGQIILYIDEGNDYMRQVSGN